MKNTLIFLSVDGIGLNSEWKGNCLKLADKPNINHLISGIYPWATISNDNKVDKYNSKKKYDSLSTDIDNNFYQMIHGNKEIKTLNDKINELVENKTFNNIKMFEDIVEHSNNFGSKYVHVFFILSNNTFHCSLNNIKFILDALIKKGLKPLVHLIADGKEDRQFNFEKVLKLFNIYLLKRNIQIASISGRDNALIKPGFDYKISPNVEDYYKTICGYGEFSFSNPRDYAIENTFNKVKDQDIKPAFNANINKFSIENNDSILFVDSDFDNFSPILHLISKNERLSNVFIASTNPIYGNVINSLMFETHKDFSKALPNVAADNDKNSLILTLSHKKGFINKFYGCEQRDNITRKSIKTDNIKNTLDYVFLANKLLIDSAMKSIGKYDFIIIHIPTIADAAREGNLKLLKFAIENFDKNLGRILNYAKATGNVIALASPYGVAEKMLNKKLEILPYNKNSIVPFVFTNGDLYPKRLKTNFEGLYSTILVTLGIANLSKETLYRSIIAQDYNKDIIRNKLIDQYEVWLKEFVEPIVKHFEEEYLSLYADFSKDEKYIKSKQQYIILKEMVKLHKSITTTPEARKAIFDKLLNYVSYNKIDFENFKYDYKKMLMSLYDDEIKLVSLKGFAARFFDSYIWRTNFKRNDKWFSKLKEEISPTLERGISESRAKKIINYVDMHIEPYQYFERLFYSEKQILSTNDAVKIVQFYENIKDEVIEVYDKYFGSKIKSDEDVYVETSDETKKNPDFEKVVAYYSSFNEVLDVIEENKANAELYNKKFKENYDALGSIEVTPENLFDADVFELNFLTRKIVAIYSMWQRNVANINKETYKDVNKTISKYDNKYQRKHEEALSAIYYDGEFFEGVDLSIQDQLELKMNDKVKVDGFFDIPTIDVDTTHQNNLVEDENTSDSFDENGNPIVVDSFEHTISTRKEYDKTSIWNKKRYEDKVNINNIIYNISNDADQMIFEDRKLRLAKEKITKYGDLSKAWNKINSVGKTDL